MERAQKILYIAVTIFVIVIICLITGFYLLIKASDKVTTEYFAQYGLGPDATMYEVCNVECQRLGKEYFKFQFGGFSTDECWCRYQNSSEQIW